MIPELLQKKLGLEIDYNKCASGSIDSEYYQVKGYPYATLSNVTPTEMELLPPSKMSLFIKNGGFIVFTIPQLYNMTKGIFDAIIEDLAKGHEWEATNDK